MRPRRCGWRSCTTSGPQSSSWAPPSRCRNSVLRLRAKPVLAKPSLAASSSPSPPRCRRFVVSLAAVRIGAIDLGIGNVLGSNLFNLLILGLDDVFYRQGPLLAGSAPSHGIAIVAVVAMYGLLLIGLTYRVLTKRFAVAWDTGAIAAVYVVAIALAYLLRG